MYGKKYDQGYDSQYQQTNYQPTPREKEILDKVTRPQLKEDIFMNMARQTEFAPKKKQFPLRQMD